MYKHIIFDFDGTLVDSIQVALTIYNRLAKELGLNPIGPLQYRHLQKSSLTERFKIIGVARHRILLIRKLFQEFRRRYHEQFQGIELWDGSRELLSRLEEHGYTVSILTSNSAENVTRFFQRQGISINGSIHSAQGIFGKKRALRHYRKVYRLRPAEVLYVGDELRDVITCRKARIDIAAVTWGFDQRAILQAENPRYLIDRQAQLLEILSIQP